MRWEISSELYFRLPESAMLSEAQRLTAGGPDAAPPVRREVGRADPLAGVCADPQPASGAYQLVAGRPGASAPGPRGGRAIAAGTASAPDPQWRYALGAVRAMTVAISSPIMLVGHAAAGSLLPAIADVLAPEGRWADLRGFRGAAGTRQRLARASTLIEHLRALADDSLLSRSSWFRQQVVELRLCVAQPQCPQRQRDPGPGRYSARGRG
jgi:hypothetical protein